MGKLTTDAADSATLLKFKELGAVGDATDWQAFQGSFNIALFGSGFSGKVLLECSFDGGATALPVARDVAGALAEFTGPVKVGAFEVEAGVLYRLKCTERANGTITARLSK